MRKYFVYLEDGEDVYKVAIPARNEKEARNYAAGNGEIIKVKDITEEYPIDLNKVIKALEVAGFGKTERDLIMRTLSITEIAE